MNTQRKKNHKKQKKKKKTKEKDLAIKNNET